MSAIIHQWLDNLHLLIFSFTSNYYLIRTWQSYFCRYNKCRQLWIWGRFKLGAHERVVFCVLDFVFQCGKCAIPVFAGKLYVNFTAQFWPVNQSQIRLCESGSRQECGLLQCVTGWKMPHMTPPGDRQSKDHTVFDKEYITHYFAFSFHFAQVV